MSTPAPTERLDTGQIAEFLRVTRKHVTNRLTKSPDFPRPVIDRGRRLRFWLFARYTLRMDQYKCMQVSMARFTAADPVSKLPRPLCLFPDRKGLEQEVLDKGVKQRAEVAPRAWHHFTKTALVAEKDPETNQFRRSVKKVGIDPHFSYANMLCDVAWSRAHGTSTFLMPDVGADKDPQVQKAEAMNLHGLPTTVAAMIESLPAGQVCGRCSAFNPETGLCDERQFLVSAKDPGCPLFVRSAAS